jgi:ribosomal protein L11 methyltransferase
VPYRIDIPETSADAFDRLVELGALDVEVRDGAIAALIPDGVTRGELLTALRIDDLRVSPAFGRDFDSVWFLSPRPVQVAGLRLLPADMDAEPGALRLTDAAAFGTGSHPTTVLCLEALAEAVEAMRPEAVLDVGSGSGVLALAALVKGVPRALGIDLDAAALEVAAANARLNGMEARLQLARGGPDTITGQWPLVLANILAAPLIEMAPHLVRRVGRHGRLVLSGIPSSVQQDVDDAYRRLGMRRLGVTARDGWVALVLQASW